MNLSYLGFEILMVVTVNSTIFWIWQHVVWQKFIEVSEVYTAFIFRVKEYAKETATRVATLLAALVFSLLFEPEYEDSTFL
jgi:hypothetical protein